MKGDTRIIAILNRVLMNELTAINQYFLHSRMFRNWGITELAEHEYKESVEEMQHADSLVDRILFLEGLPNLQNLGKLLIGEDVREMLECDLALENAAIPVLREGIALCENENDYVSRQLLDSILKNEEEHVDWLEGPSSTSWNGWGSRTTCSCEAGRPDRPLIPRGKSPAAFERRRAGSSPRAAKRGWPPAPGARRTSPCGRPESLVPRPRGNGRNWDPRRVVRI